jgi:hypothetical protein
METGTQDLPVCATAEDDLSPRNAALLERDDTKYSSLRLTKPNPLQATFKEDATQLGDELDLILESMLKKLDIKDDEPPKKVQPRPRRRRSYSRKRCQLSDGRVASPGMFGNM